MRVHYQARGLQSKLGLGILYFPVSSGETRENCLFLAGRARGGKFRVDTLSVRISFCFSFFFKISNAISKFSVLHKN